MNPKIQFKLIRNIHYSIFKDYSKTIIVDANHLINGKFEDDDLNSMYELTNDIKKQIPFPNFIRKTVSTVCPSITLSRELDDSVVYELSSEKNELNLFRKILCFDYFDKLTFAIAILLVNYLYYHNNHTFLVIYDSNKEKLYQACKNQIELQKIYNDIIISNKCYHTTSKITDLESLVNIINHIDIEYLKMLKIGMIYIHGSFARGTKNEYSDIDLIVETSLSLQTNYSDIHLLCKMLFERYLGDKIDITLSENNKKEAAQGFLRNAYESAILIREIK
jgi:predicted nucleotidyltransferase